MKKKRKIKKKIVVLIVFVVIAILAIFAFVLFKNPIKGSNHAKVIQKISEYGYVLEEDQPKIYKDLFQELDKVLKEEKIDEEKYAELVSQMFAIDFYNLDNKVSKNDVGGIQFFMEDYVDNFILKASDTVYKYIEQNVYGDREQDLPVVVSSDVKNVENDEYKDENLSDNNTYVVTVILEYKENIGYPEEVEVKLMHNDKKLEIYEIK